MKAASKEYFGVFWKYARIADLLIVYIWYVDNLEKTEIYALTYPEALAIATKLGWTKTASWKKDGYNTTAPSSQLHEMLRPYRMHRGDWKKKILAAQSA